MKIIETIKLTLQKAQEERNKTATFHSLVLLNANLLKDLDPYEFCRSVGVKRTYHIEFRKMIATAHTLSELGYSIQKK
jgi:dihydroorotase